MIGALVTACFAAAAVVGLRARCDRRFSSYDPTRDQHYDFTGSHVQVFEVTLDGNGFTWPEGAGTWDSALLEIGVQCSAVGRIVDPQVEVAAHGLTTRHHLERGAAGLRLLNISGLRSDLWRAGEAVAVKIRQAAITSQTARLYLSSTPLPDRPRTLVLASHPDDAEIAAFGFYARSDAFVVTITAGEHAGFYLQRARHAGAENAAVHARVWDSITVPFYGDVPPDRCVNLGYADATLAELYENRGPRFSHGAEQIAAGRQLNLSPLTPPAPEVACWSALVADLAHLLREIQPEVIITPHPLLDDHPDHAFTTLALCEALAAVESNPGQLLLYVNHSPRSSLYPFGRRDDAISPPPHFGEPAPFQTVFSEPLSAEMQERKFIALEAMHDLRTLPADDPPSWVRLVRTTLAELRGKISGRGRAPTSYFRRAVRPNELFFAVPFSDAPMLVQQFTAEWKAGRVRWHVCP